MALTQRLFLLLPQAVDAVLAQVVEIQQVQVVQVAVALI
jgi:hypothetical protein